MRNVFAIGIVSMFLLFSLVSATSETEFWDNDDDDALSPRQFGGSNRILAVLQTKKEHPTEQMRPGRRYGVSKHQAFRFGKRSAGTKVELFRGDSNGNDGEKLDNYLSKLLEKHKGSGVFRWGRR